MPKGNFVAYQPLKPTQELKVGDLAMQQVDYLIKKGEAERAAALKREIEQNKSVMDMAKHLDVNFKEVIPFMTEKTANLYSLTKSTISDLMIKATGYNVPYKEKAELLAKANSLATQYESIVGTFGGERMKNYYDNLSKDPNSFFKGDPAYQLALGSQTRMISDFYLKDGVLMVNVARGDDNSEDNTEAISANDLLTIFAKTPEKNLLPDIDKWYLDFGKSLVDESKKGDGYSTTQTTKFNEDKAKNLVTTKFGNEETFKDNSFSQQLLYSINGKLPKGTKEEYQQLMDYSLKTFRAINKESNSKVAEYTPEQLESQRLDNALKRKALTQPSGGRGGSSGSNTPTTMQNGNIRMLVNGQVYNTDNVNIVNNKNGRFVIRRVKNKNGQTVVGAYRVGSDDNGNMIINGLQPMTTAETKSLLGTENFRNLVPSSYSTLQKMKSSKAPIKIKYGTGYPQYSEGSENGFGALNY